jgi:hypothetical protein
MRIRSAIAILLFALASALVCSAQIDQISSLEPGLRDALVHDASCSAQSAPRIADDPSFSLQSHVRVQTFRGVHPGSIVVLDGACDCWDSGTKGSSKLGNCATYVYLRTGDSYRLVLHGVFASMHPLLKSLRFGMPSLTARFDAGDSKAETFIFEWTGKDYKPTLCASIVESTGKRRASITKHACTNSLSLPPQ